MILYYIYIIYIFFIIEGLLLNQFKLDTQIDDVNILLSSTEKHHNILSILTSYINLFYISLITGISEINMPKKTRKLRILYVKELIP